MAGGVADRSQSAKSIQRPPSAKQGSTEFNALLPNTNPSVAKNYGRADDDSSQMLDQGIMPYPGPNEVLQAVCSLHWRTQRVTTVFC